MTALVAYRNTLVFLKNAASPVDRLPPEILVQICLCAMALRPPFGRPPRLPQVTFSAVCKRWREVMLSQPLWEFLASRYNSSMVEAIIQRSKNVPRKVYIDRCGPGFVDMIQPHVSSIKHLTCDFPQTSPPAYQPHPLVIVSPVLERLELRRCKIADGDRILSVSDGLYPTTVARVPLPQSLRPSSFSSPP